MMGGAWSMMHTRWWAGPGARCSRGVLEGAWCPVQEALTEARGLALPHILLPCPRLSQRLIVCLEESLYIHNIRDMKVLHTIRETPPNPTGEQGQGSADVWRSLS